jgi:CBS domain-containing protein
MAGDLLVRDVMTTDVLAFHPSDRVQDAYARLAARDVDGAPVVDDAGRVVGVLTTDDLLVEETRLHYPTVVSLFGAYLELPSAHRHFEDELRKAVAATVGDAMEDEPVTCGEDDTLERVATLMHEHHVSRLPVVRDGALVGIVARGDVLRAVMGRPSSGSAGA